MTTTLTAWTNARGHWATTASRKKHERMMGALVAADAGAWAHEHGEVAPHHIAFTRLSSRGLDDDNLPSAFKYVRDGFAAWHHVDDSPSGPFTWSYSQRKPTSDEQPGFLVEVHHKERQQ